MYHEILAILSHVVENWGSFDSFCLRNCGGIDPLDLPSRRMVNLVWAWITEGMDQEAINALIISIQPNTYNEQKKKARRAEKKEPTTTSTPYTPAADKGKDKFRAPEGWKPAGWSEERSLHNAKQFMKFQANPTVQPK